MLTPMHPRAVETAALLTAVAVQAAPYRRLQTQRRPMRLRLRLPRLSK
jgi:hypothetical protein